MEQRKEVILSDLGKPINEIFCEENDLWNILMSQCADHKYFSELSEEEEIKAFDQKI